MNNDIKVLSASQIIIRFIIAIFVIVTLVGIVNGFVLNRRITPVSELQQDKTSYHYVNDLYISDGRHYDYMLDKKEKKLYDAIYTAIRNRQSSTVLNFEEFDYKAYNASYTLGKAFDRVFQALSMDHPELIYYSPAANMFQYTLDTKKAIMNFTYSMTEEEYQNALIYIDAVLHDIKEQTKNMSDYEKCKFAYDWVASKHVYGDLNGNFSHSAYSVFSMKENPVCEGYGKGLQIILQNIGVNSIYVVGSIVGGGGHGWNIVQLDGQYYNIDLTCSFYDSFPSYSNICYAGFLFPKNKNYSILWDEMVPKINGKKYLYFNYAGQELTFNNIPEFYADLKQRLANTDKNFLEIKIKNIGSLKRNRKEFELYMGKSYTYMLRFDDIIYIKK